jgi:GH18 family chitinase
MLLLILPITFRYEKFNNLKKANPSLKTSLAVGGWNLGSAPFTRMVATAASRQQFASGDFRNFNTCILNQNFSATLLDIYSECILLKN